MKKWRLLMRINRLKITNFKNFNGEVEFDFSKNIILLYGANGYGKSTIFEAIEWCLTGKIEKYNKSEHDFRLDVSNKLLLGKKDFIVEVKLSFDDFEIIKSFSVGKDILLSNTSSKIITKENEQIIGMPKCESYLKNISYGDFSYAKTEYSQLLKTSYILSQDQISNFIKSSDGSERYESLADIMGLKSILTEFENFKNLIIKLNKQTEQLTNEKNEIENKITTSKNFLQVFDQKEYIRIVSNLRNHNEIKKTISITEKEIDMLISKKLNNQNSLNHFLKTYNDLNNEIKIMSINQIDTLIQMKKNKLKLMSSKINRANILLEKVKDREKQFLKSKNNTKDIQFTYDDLKENERKINEIKIENMNFSNINKEIKKIENEIFNLNFIFEYKQFLKKNSSKHTNNILQKDKLTKEFYINDKKQRKRNIWLENLENLGENEKEILLNRLINGIENIQDYIKDNNIKECPICSKVDINLEDKVNENLRSKINILDKSKERYEKIKFLKDRIYLNDLKINESNNKIKEELRILNKDIFAYQNKIDSYINSSYYDFSNANTSIEEIQEKIDIKSDEIKKLKELEKYNFEINRLTKILKNYNIDSKFENIGQFILKINDLININEIRKQKILLKKNELIHLFEDETKKLEEYKKNLAELKLLNEVDNNISLSNVNIISLEKVLSISKNIEELNLLKTMITKKTINDNTEKQLEDLNIDLTNMNKKVDYFNGNIKHLEKYKNKKEKLLGENVLDYLNHETFSIKKYFKFLNPLPGESELVFTSKKVNDISIQLVYRKDLSLENGGFSNAEKIMSSGQLNVLALSIFLAINQEQKLHPFDFVGIDDPIQNMDDVNQFTVCDVLSQIDKQLIFSTHDKNFLKLFINKNNKSDIIIYNLNSPYMDNDSVEKISF